MANLNEDALASDTVCIVGAGVIGLSTAYHLASRAQGTRRGCEEASNCRLRCRRCVRRHLPDQYDLPTLHRDGRGSESVWRVLFRAMADSWPAAGVSGDDGIWWEGLV